MDDVCGNTNKKRRRSREPSVSPCRSRSRSRRKRDEVDEARQRKLKKRRCNDDAKREEEENHAKRKVTRRDKKKGKKKKHEKKKKKKKYTELELAAYEEEIAEAKLRQEQRKRGVFESVPSSSNTPPNASSSSAPANAKGPLSPAEYERLYNKIEEVYDPMSGRVRSVRGTGIYMLVQFCMKCDFKLKRMFSVQVKSWRGLFQRMNTKSSAMLQLITIYDGYG